MRATRIGPADRSDAPGSFVLRRQAQVLPAALFQQMPAQILLVAPLHHHHLAAVFGSFTRVDITTSHQSLVALRTESDSTSLTLWGSSQTMRSPPSPGDGAAHRRGQPVAGAVVVEPALGVLVAGEGKDGRPSAPDTRATRSGAGTSPNRGCSAAPVAAVEPAPLGPPIHSQAGQNTDTSRLFMCRGGTLMSRLRICRGDRLEVLDDGVDVPARDERCRRLDNRPGLADELPQAAGGEFASISSRR
jgi:hypothetical protein